MNSISTKAIAAVLLTAVGLSATASAVAQSVPASPEVSTTQKEDVTQDRLWRHDGGEQRRPGGEGGFLDFARGSEAVEVALVRLSHRLDLTAEQQGLLETLKTDALATAEDFATATEGLRPQEPVEGEAPAMPDMSTRFANRIAFEKAQLAALEAVQPSVTAFFDSLTDEQMARLQPQPGEHGGPRGGMHKGGQEGGPRPGFGG